jgi:hypothetical protein
MSQSAHEAQQADMARRAQEAMQAERAELRKLLEREMDPSKSSEGGKGDLQRPGGHNGPDWDLRRRS